jgi:hypothetical protein
VKLTVGDRFRLFFHGAVKEAIAFNRAAQELRLYRDAFGGVTDAVVNQDGPRAGRVYVMIDGQVLARIFERVYGADHPHTKALREVIAQGVDHLRGAERQTPPARVN